jgi:hypothetical protein
MKIGAVAPRLFPWLEGRFDLAFRLVREFDSALHLPCCQGQDVSLDHVAATLEVERESEDFFKPPVRFVRKALWIELHDVV